MKASAFANSNIALVKYWGKRDERLHLPQNNSISMTASGMLTRTTVEISEKYKKNILNINGQDYSRGTKEYDAFERFLSILDIKGHVKVMSENSFPTSAGLASSASGYAALATALNEAMQLGLDEKELSVLARRGSGSASRSIFSGFVEWHKGVKNDGTDSFSEQIADKEHWPEFRIIICITSKLEKKIKSREAMRRTVETSPYYSGWLHSIDKDIQIMKEAINKKHFSKVGTIAETNCLKMHALMWTTQPPIIYQNPTTIRIMNSIIEWRQQGLEAYFTMDAGPQVKILCLEENLQEILEKLKGMNIETIITKPGQGAIVTDNHLF